MKNLDQIENWEDPYVDGHLSHNIDSGEIITRYDQMSRQNQGLVHTNSRRSMEMLIIYGGLALIIIGIIFVVISG